VAADSTERSRQPVRRRSLIWFGLGAVVLTSSGLVAARFIRSPQQLLADTAPPERGILTAPVERRVLKDTLVIRGQVGATATLDVTPSSRAEAGSIVTGIKVKAGDTFSQGSVLLEVSGRPLTAMLGTVPSYRDLRPGVHGADVAQLQAALKALGHDPRESDGLFGPGTKRALSDFYRAKGYDAATTGTADEQAVAAATERVRLAERALAEAKDALAELKANPPPAPSPGQPSPVAEVERKVRFVTEDLAAARATLSQLQRTTGVMLPQSEVVFLPSFPARVEKLEAAVGTVVKAPLMTLSSGALVVRARISPGQRGLLKVGLPVEVASEAHGITAPGRVEAIGELTLQEGGGQGHVVTVAATNGQFDGRLAGADVRLTIEAASSDGEVLVVPVSAVFADSDGRASVVAVTANGTQRRVAVTAGVSGDGYVAVTPTVGSLEPGDLVLVGAGGQP
jgi:peptidoglycan hydrolase-like protein with peptidoglycan-binding domain